MRKRIVIDTDPGQDDAIALMLALGSTKQLDILGIVTVAGNAEIALTYENAKKVCGIADPENALKIPIYRGEGSPLARRLVTCQGFHGANGLADLELPTPACYQYDKSGIEFYHEILERNIDTPITICALGPLTNLAKVLRSRPSLSKSISALVLMGGAFQPPGNITPAAEFNMCVDPEAAQIVISTLSDFCIEVVMVPLDVTHKTAINAADIARFRQLKNKSGNFVAEILSRWGTKPSYAPLGGKPLHDPCVIAYLLNPNIFSGVLVNVEIETMGQWTAGMSVVDRWHESGRSPNVHFLTDLNRSRYVDILHDTISTLP